MKAPAAQVDGNTWSFAKGRLTTRTINAGKGIDAKVEWKVRFDVAGKRKSLLLDGERAIRCIYLLDGNDLVVCGGKELPAEFTTGAGGSGRMLWILKRDK